MLSLKRRSFPLLFVALLLLAGCNREKTGLISGKVIRIADGDTLTILDASNTQHRIRLSGIDAPERTQDFYQVSRDNLSNLVFGKDVVVEYYKTDRWGRLVGKVILDGKDECLEQVKAGLAWHFKRYEKEQSLPEREQYAAAEKEAHENHRGLWRDSQPIPPWDYRRKTKGTEEESEGKTTEGGNTNLNRAVRPSLSVTPLNRLSENVKVDRQDVAENNHSAYLIRGNRRSMIYHWPGCPDYEKIAEHNRVPFASAEEAEKAGYRAARNCD